MAHLHRVDYSKVKSIWLLRSEAGSTLATAKLDSSGGFTIRLPGGKLLGFTELESSLLSVANQLEEVGVNYKEVYL